MPPLPKPSFAFGLKPEAAIEYLRSKGFKLTFDYNEMMHDAHHKAFTVAKVTRLDLLSDIHGSIAEAMANGKRFEDWKKQIIPTLETKGWWGKKEIVNPSTGEVKEIVIGGRRLKTIFKTNTMVARSTARYDQQMRSGLEYLQYIGGLSEHPRMNHLQKNGIILPKVHVWWTINYPQNAWGCHCEARAWSRAQIERRGWKVYEGTPENIASPDWAYNPGAGNRVGKLSKIDLDSSLSLLPKLSDAKRKEYSDLTEEQLKDRFYGALEVKAGDMYVDSIGDPMIVDDSLFTTGSGHSKLTKQDRHYYIDEIAATVSDPDEIYLEYDDKAKRLVKKMFRYFKGDKGSKRAIVVLFEYLSDKTQGVSAHVIDSSGGVEKKRIDKLIYKKGQE